MSAPSKNIPKFSTFRAKAPAQEPSTSSTSSKRQRSPESRHRSVKRHTAPDSEHQPSSRRHTSSKHVSNTPSTHHRHREHHDPNHPSQKPPAADNPFLIPSRPEDPDLFVFDAKGDAQNIAYQRLHKYTIPPYHRLGYGNILGLDLRLKIDRVQSTDDKVFILDKGRLSKDRPQRLLLKRQKVHELSLLRADEQDALDLAKDFVALVPLADQHRASVSSNDDSDDYKTIDRPRNLVAPTQLLHEPLDLTSDVDFEARQQNAQLFRATKINPTNLQAWLDLADHQQHLVRPGTDVHALTNSERRALADMRVAVYEKALKNFSADEASTREILILRLLQEASLAWEPQKYMQKLQETLEQHPTSFPVWTQYLDACQANPFDFRFEDVKAFFVRGLHRLASSKVETHGSEVPNMMLYLLLRYTVFLLDTGYNELSIAIWQALCEYHFFRPERLATSEKGQVLIEFEQFWESETARIGEHQAQGWRSFQPDNVVVSEEQLSDHNDRLTSRLPFKSFSARESNATSALRFPGRALDEVGADDPFHIVFFSDIKGILETTAGGFGQSEFLDALLCYLGLPTMSTSTIASETPRPKREWRSDTFLSQGLLQCGSIEAEDHHLNGSRVQSYQISTDLLFSRTFEAMFAPQSRTSNTSDQKSKDKVTRFAQRTLSSFVEMSPDDDALAEYYSAFVLYCFPEEASKLARNILKKRPSSLRLYNACAIIEARLDKPEKAAQIWSGAINMKDSFPITVQQELVLLWRSWIWCDLEANRPQIALAHLTSFGGSPILQDHGPVAMSTATVLRLRKAFKDGFDYSITQSQPRLATLNAEMLAIMAYLTETNTLQSSVAEIQDLCNAASKRTKKSHVLLEMLHQVKAGIIAHHIRQKRPYRPAFVRFELETSIALFPNNTIFLEMYRDNEARFRIDDRVRSILKSQVLTSGQSPMVAWTFAIDQELHRYTSQSSGSTAESVRATFNRALLTTGSPVRHSKTLWMKWFWFEMQAASTEASEKRATRRRATAEQQPLQKLKQVYLSGLHYLPWFKDWVLLGLQAFDRDDDSGWSTGDLRRLYNVLVERELRIRVEGLEDVLDAKMEDR